MIDKLITYQGSIHFDPVNYTKKHNNQASWKRMALVMFDGDLTEYYAWFIERRYGLKLNKPLRSAHISFINDSLNDMKKGLNIEDEDQLEIIWNNVKNKWNEQPIDIVLNVDARSSIQHWWLNVQEEYRKQLHEIRAELGLGRPYWGLHMSIGYANEKMKDQSDYIVKLCNTYGREYN